MRTSTVDRVNNYGGGPLPAIILNRHPNDYDPHSEKPDKVYIYIYTHGRSQIKYRAQKMESRCISSTFTHTFAPLYSTKLSSIPRQAKVFAVASDCRRLSSSLRSNPLRCEISDLSIFFLFYRRFSF